MADQPEGGAGLTVDEARAKVEAYREGLTAKAGAVCMFSETGPAGMSMIDALLAVIEQQGHRIAELERKVGGS